MSSLEGLDKLNRRLNAISKPTGILRTIQLHAVAEAKALVRPMTKTGYLARSIGPGAITSFFAIVHASANYAGYVEFGTKPHVIRPRNRKVLAWPANAGGRRLSGRARSGAAMTFARVVHHPGTRAQPFLVPGAKKALEGAGFRNIIVNEWNAAA